MRLADPTTVADVAREAGTSVSGLKRLLRAKLDTTPAAYLSTLRIDEAERLLAEGRLPIAEIAMVTGYSDQSALNRAVRRERGTTPARIRKTPIAKD
ncbi:helix-turn-helix domain-containing protein [Sagittula sp.]